MITAVMEIRKESYTKECTLNPTNNCYWRNYQLSKLAMIVIHRFSSLSFLLLVTVSTGSHRLQTKDPSSARSHQAHLIGIQRSQSGYLHL
jgi:hypothetical protein